MFRAVTEDIEPEYGPVNARRDLELWIAIRESARRGSAWITLPIQEMTGFECQIHEAYERKYGGHPISEVDALKDAPFSRASVIWGSCRMAVKTTTL